MNRRSKLFLSTVLSAALALFIYFLVLAISKQNQHTFDLTKNQRNTLTQQSLDLLGRLDKPVKAWVFEADGRGRKDVESLMQRYQKVNPTKFEYEINDVERRPTLAKELEVRTNGQAVLEFKGDEAGKRRERATNLEETALTTALLKLSHSKERKVYFLQGHGERGLDQKDPGSLSEWKAALVTEGFQSEPLSLVSEKEVPKDAAALVLAGPTSAMLEGELKKVKDFLDAGGHLMLAAEMETPKQYKDLLAEYGVDLKEQVIIDEASSLVNAEPVFAVGAVYSPNSPVTRDFKTNTLFRLARPVEKGPEKAGYQVDPLVKTPPSAYPVPLSEVVGKTQFAFTPDADKAESLGLAVAVTHALE
ncbi:MAG: GldG family protein, partial [Candidatus Eremiobacteraeota bacterium]|nr:GldG family protein [Candidatus Eremiobacteraeota bacterium]